MTSPPSSLPSPVPSSSSGHHPHTFSSLAMPPPAGPNRTHSATSGVSAASGRESKGSGALPNVNDGSVKEMYANGTQDFSHHTPPPHLLNGGYPSGSSQHPFLPPVTSSPPPQVRTYVPPPQHAMAPDPIHTMMGQSGGTSSGGMSSPTQGGWNSSQNGWRPPASQSGFPSSGPHFPRQLPNGHMPPMSMQHQLPPNPNETYHGRGPMSPFGMNGRPGSRQGESRDRRRDRDSRDDGEDEVITTIFVVGFPDDMLVSFDPPGKRKRV